MTAYFLILAFLMAMAVVDAPRWSNLIGVICVAVLVAFAGLRHETGFDWLEYESFYDYSAPLGARQPDIQSHLGLHFEFGYVFLNRLFVSLGLSFQDLLIASSLIGIVPIYVVARAYKSSPAFVFLLYFGFVFLTTQMAIVRQSLAFGALLMAIAAICRQRTLQASFWVIVAVAFHSFVIVLAPLVFLTRERINAKVAIAFCLAGLGLSFVGINVLVWLSENALSFLGSDLIATKVAFYAGVQPNAISPQTLILIGWHCWFLLYIDHKYRNSKDVSVRIAFLFTLACLFFHCYFAVHPVFWQRAMAMALVLQAAVIYRDFAATGFASFRPLLIKAAVGSASLFALTYTLLAESSIVYQPYQNVVLLDLANDRGDGRVRYLEERRRGSAAVRQSRLN